MLKLYFAIPKNGVARVFADSCRTLHEANDAAMKLRAFYKRPACVAWKTPTIIIPPLPDEICEGRI